MLRKGVAPMPPAIQTIFLLEFFGRIKSPARSPATIFCPFFIFCNSFLKLLEEGLNLTPTRMSFSVGDEAIVKKRLLPLLSAFLWERVHSKYCPGTTLGIFSAEQI